MCGICGQINFDRKPVHFATLKKMTDALSHRGPDGEGFYFSREKSVGLGHRRLAIIDLKGGVQPMTNEDKTIWIVFNGEIYNFLEIRRKLEQRGHKFRTKSDTEVIIHAYEEFGENCVKFFNGMFAFAIWDERKKSLFLARDRLGKKPLFYLQTQTSFIFASEIKAILKNPEVKKEIDLGALNMYLSLGYFLAPLTIIKNVRKLPAASFLILKKGQVQQKEYWDFNPTLKKDLEEETWIERFKELLRDSVQIRLKADVPLGAFLSGGIDSTTIASFMKELCNFKPKTFSIGFEEKDYSELSFAKKAADFLKTDHCQLIVEPETEEILKKIVLANDEPLADTSVLPMYFLAERTKKKVSVALSGDGGDENLAGYDTYLADKLFTFYQHFSFIHPLVKKVVEWWPTSFGKVSFDYKLKQFSAAGLLDPKRAHYSWRTIFNEEEKKKLLVPGLYKKIKDKDPFHYFKKYFDRYPEGNFLDRAMYVDIKTWLVDDILVKVDRASMAHGLEVRSPFLDYRLVEFLASVPVGVKLRGLTTKYLLKKMVKGMIPEEIINRPKEGFNAPIPIWLRRDLKKVLEDFLSPINVKRSGFFNYEFIAQLMEEYFRGRKDNSLKLWSLLNFVLWEKNFL